ncbi:MAG: hypothetical protein WA821_04750 [Anaerolineales bacterium]
MNIAISITEGRTVRDLFYNGLLDYFVQAGCFVTVFTEAATVPEFTGLWQSPQIEFRPFSPCEPSVWDTRAYWMGRRLVRLKLPGLARYWIDWREKLFSHPGEEYAQFFRERRPAILLTTHAHLPQESELLSAAHRLGIPTLGVVRSWDNVYKGLRSRPQRLAVWNEINRREVIELEGYLPEAVTIIGSPQFDPYFDSGEVWSRARLAEAFGLDPHRLILVFASLGYFFPGFDETCWMDVLLQMIDEGSLPGNPQLICRLHPWSRLEHFQKYASHPNVRLSYVNRYWPALTWYMTRDDVVLVGNMLRHADVVITPGSTITLEAAIFDRPTIVPIFHPYQPQRARKYFSTWVLGKHFGRIERLDLVPIIRQQADFAPAIRKALQDPAWYQAQRAQLVRDYIHFTDGHSTRRLADYALAIARP